MVKIPIGISFEYDILKKIDKERGEVPRSRYIANLLSREKYDKWICKSKNPESHDSETANLDTSCDLTNS